MKNPKIKIDSPIELAAYGIYLSCEMAKTEEDMDKVDQLIQSFDETYPGRVTKELQGCAKMRRRELKLEALIRSNKNKIYDTHNWFRALSRRGRADLSDVPARATGNTKKA